MVSSKLTTRVLSFSVAEGMVWANHRLGAKEIRIRRTAAKISVPLTDEIRRSVKEGFDVVNITDQARVCSMPTSVQ